jgi:HNH endonuclease/Sigma-70, region 4
VIDENNFSFGPHKKWRRICRKCRSRQVCEYQKQNYQKTLDRHFKWRRSSGLVKQYPCKTCETLCYKKYAHAFCSDQCRFMYYVEKTDTCWLWTGAKNRQGYGKVCYQGNTTTPAHRASYMIFKGEITNGLLVCHSCDVKACVNPDHLWLGTNSDNIQDMCKKGRNPSKLKPQDILKMRDLAENQGYTQKQLCELFGITNGTVSQIINRKKWTFI